jgi:linoleoyl-CoA desaturase
MAVLSRFSEAAARSDEGERFVAASRSPTVLLSVCRQTGVLGWAVVLPALLHPLWCVVVVYLVGAGLAGLILATVLQWAHCVEGATFLSVQHGQERLPGTWLRIQVEATRNVHLPRWLSWYVGGLDHQIEHHLFPRYPHTIYRHLVRTIEEFCRDNGIDYGRHQSLGAAIRAHYRWLRQMGKPPVQVQVEHVPTPADASPRPLVG